MTKRRNGECSIFPYRNGYAAYAWVTTPEGDRRRKWVYGKTHEEVHTKWIKLQTQAAEGPVSTSGANRQPVHGLLAPRGSQAESRAENLREI